MLSQLLQLFLDLLMTGAKSNPQPVISGVPQGSVLGPLLFLILIGDIDKDVTTSFLSSFADDTRVGHGITCEEDIRSLQKDLQAVYDWAKANNMGFNFDKVERLSYKPSSSSNGSHSYIADNGSPIEEKHFLVDLGVSMSNDGSFTRYIQEKVA